MLLKLQANQTLLLVYSEFKRKFDLDEITLDDLFDRGFVMRGDT